MQFDTPILFIIFKRPQVSATSFEQIQKVKPAKLYISCDAARPHVKGEDLLVEETKSIIMKMIDWDCEVHTLFHEVNQGCSKAVYQAINWMFEQEDKGIILEDDCVVSQSFFPFTKELLETYKHDDRIGMITGTNLIKTDMHESYVFSRYKSCWGWATWKRAWQRMDMLMQWKNTDYRESVLRNMGHRGRDIKYWEYRMKLVEKDRVSSWAWRWYFTMASQNQLSIFPKVNLVTNIGFGEGATHTTNKRQPTESIASHDLEFPLVHPEYVVPHDGFDKAFYKDNNSFYYTLMRYIPYSLKNIVKKLIR